jgi:hypothetical protein
MSQEILDKLNASHLVVNINATICSGFNNQCSSDFPSLLIRITFIHENTFLKESFITRVLILPKSPTDIIIGRKTIKTINFATKTPSHFGCEINLTSRTGPVIDFGDTINNNDMQEIYGVCIPSNHDLSKDFPVAKRHAQSCNESLVLRKTAGLKSDSDVSISVLTVTRTYTSPHTR